MINQLSLNEKYMIVMEYYCINKLYNVKTVTEDDLVTLGGLLSSYKDVYDTMKQRLNHALDQQKLFAVDFNYRYLYHIYSPQEVDIVIKYNIPILEFTSARELVPKDMFLVGYEHGNMVFNEVFHYDNPISREDCDVKQVKEDFDRAKKLYNEVKTFLYFCNQYKEAIELGIDYDKIQTKLSDVMSKKDADLVLRVVKLGYIETKVNVLNFLDKIIACYKLCVDTYGCISIESCIPYFSGIELLFKANETYYIKKTVHPSLYIEEDD